MFTCKYPVFFFLISEENVNTHTPFVSHILYLQVIAKMKRNNYVAPEVMLKEKHILKTYVTFISSDGSNYLQLYSHCIQFYNIFSKHFSGTCAISGYFYHLQDFIFHYLPFEESNLFIKILLKHQNYHLSQHNYIVMDSNNLRICKNAK